MPKATFLNLPAEKQKEISGILLKVFSEKHASLVTVAEIVKEMKMSRSAFYKYFDDLEDAYIYIVQKYSVVLHGTILKQIMAHKNNFFEGIRSYLIQCSQGEVGGHDWQVIKFLTIVDSTQRGQRLEISQHQSILQQWTEVLELNHFKISNQGEALSFLYFMMDMTQNLLADYLVNDWSEEELIRDYDFRIKWLVKGLV